MVGLAATSSVYEKLFHNNYYNLNQLVTALIGSAVYVLYMWFVRFQK